MRARHNLMSKFLWSTTCSNSNVITIFDLRGAEVAKAGWASWGKWVQWYWNWIARFDCFLVLFRCLLNRGITPRFQWVEIGDFLWRFVKSVGFVCLFAIQKLPILIEFFFLVGIWITWHNFWSLFESATMGKFVRFRYCKLDVIVRVCFLNQSLLMWWWILAQGVTDVMLLCIRMNVLENNDIWYGLGIALMLPCCPSHGVPSFCLCSCSLMGCRVSCKRCILDHFPNTINIPKCWKPISST
jgi:hypothetical protein